MNHEGCCNIANIILFKKTYSKVHKQNTRIPKTSSKFGGIPYKYISYESIIGPKTKRQLGETTIASKARSNKRNMVIGTHQK